jgi:hypothetical protein
MISTVRPQRVHNESSDRVRSVTVPYTDYLVDEPRKRWINAYTGGKNVDTATIPGGDDRNAVGGRRLHNIKKHWCLRRNA